MRRLIMLIGLLALLAGCADLGSPTYLPNRPREPRPGSAAPPAPPNPPSVSQTLNLGVGQTLDLTLDSNPTTGYRWFLTQAPDPAVVLVETHAFVRDREATGQAGSGGREIFAIRGVSPGFTEMVLEYHRPWERERGQPPAKVHRITLRVR
ncbi:MAG: protease inhibitor I42 family protein [Desulfarculus sp.]|nr:protease inhibitor I42 family protein [Desulfarculus sp.]